MSPCDGASRGGAPCGGPRGGGPRGGARHSRRSRVAGGFAVLALVVSACSVPKDVEARKIAADRIPQFLQNQVKQRTIFLLRGSRLTPVLVTVPLSLSPEKTVQSLLDRLREPLTPELKKSYSNSLEMLPNSIEGYDVKLESVEGDLVTLDISNAIGIDDQNPPALGQLVLTITSVPGFSRVDFVKNGKRLSQVRAGLGVDQTFVATPVRKESFDQPIEVSHAPVFFVKNGRLRQIEVNFEGSDPSDSPLYTAQLYLAALEDESNLEGAPAGYKTLLPGLDAAITEDAVGNFVLSFNENFRKLSSTDQALAIGQIVQSLRLAGQIRTLPPIALVVADKTVGTLDLTTYQDLVDSGVDSTDPVSDSPVSGESIPPS